MKLYSSKSESEKASIKPGLKKARKAANLTQQQLADALDVSLKTVMNWEQGIVSPSLETTMKIADILHCDIDFLTGRIQCSTHDTQFIHDQTGLSEKAIAKLQAEYRTNRATGRSDTISHLVEHPLFTYLVSLLPLKLSGNSEPFTAGSAAVIQIERRAVIRSELKTAIVKIAETIQDQTPADEQTALARIMYGLLFNLYDEKRLTDDQFQQTLAAYDKGNFDFVPESLE